MIRSSKNAKALGQGLTEYLVVVGVVAILLVPAVRHFSGSNADAYDAAQGKIDQIAQGHAPGVGESPDAADPAGGPNDGTPTTGPAGHGPAGGNPGPTGGNPGAPDSGDPQVDASYHHHRWNPWTPHHPVASPSPKPSPAPSPKPSPAPSPTPSPSPAPSPAPKGAHLEWNASTSPNVTGYNIYRSTVPGGPYFKVNGSLVAGTDYRDTTVQSGMTYYYVSTAVDAAGLESGYSNEASYTAP